MPGPDSSTILQRPELGAIAFEYMQEASQMGFIGLDVMPVFEVPKQSADYPIIPLESLLKLPKTKRAPRGNYNRSDYNFKTGTYKCEEHGWEELLDDVEAELYASYFDGEEVAVKRAIDIILRSQEQRIALAVFNTTNITNNAAVSTEWSTITATPRADVTTAKQAMRAASGLKPNAMVMAEKVFENLLLVTEIKDALKYTNPIEMGGDEAQRSALATYFGVSRLLVAGAVKDSAKKGKAASIADIWSDEYIGLFKLSAGGPDLREPALGRTFLWTGDSPQNTVVESYREDKKRSNVYRVRHNVDDDAFTFTGAGYLLSNITA